MTALLPRKIVRIDEERCNGCGECVPSCAESAIRIVNGKARLASDSVCDGMGACLGRCPLGAITIEERQAEPFDTAAVEALKRELETGGASPQPTALQGAAKARTPEARAHAPHAVPPGPAPAQGGCPGTMLRQLPTLAPRPASSRPGQSSSPPASGASSLRHWPVQLPLVPPVGPLWQDADVLIAADCVPFAMPDFHERLLAGKSVAVACPKLDDVRAHVEKLTRIFAHNTVRSVTVAHMEVPCCFGIVQAVRLALEASGRSDIAVHDVTVGVDGTLR